MNLPDPDAIKMFVGQVPKEWTETNIKDYFEEFGKIFLINLLRDKVTKHSRGCCFITYFTRKASLEAQNACHNIRCLPGMNHPIQIKPADNENRHERKIFVGMLNKGLNESDLRLMFQHLGLIEEVSILRDGQGVSRACGFVTFASKSSAVNAIKNMHQSTQMEGCSSPLVVKLADTQRDKGKNSNNQQGQQQLPCSVLSTATAAALIAQNAQKYITLLQLIQNSTQTESLASLKLPNTHNQTQLQNISMSNDLLSQFSQFTSNSSPLLALSKNISQNQGLGVSDLGQSVLNTNITNIQSPNTQFTQNQHQAEGPDGSNLFIYHLPPEFLDADLYAAFLPYGTILSAKVFIDKTTNLSKCFGFVSYDNGISAQLAIQAMNGFQIGSKRLKVQLKRPKEKPY